MTTEHTEIPKEPDPYLEARLGLLEDLLGQMMAGFPDKIATALSDGYNQRRNAIIAAALPGTKFAEATAKAVSSSHKEASLILVPKH